MIILHDITFPEGQLEPPDPPVTCLGCEGSRISHQLTDRILDILAGVDEDLIERLPYTDIESKVYQLLCAVFRTSLCGDCAREQRP